MVLLKRIWRSCWVRFSLIIDSVYSKSEQLEELLQEVKHVPQFVLALEGVLLVARAQEVVGEKRAEPVEVRRRVVGGTHLGDDVHHRALDLGELGVLVAGNHRKHDLVHLVREEQRHQARVHPAALAVPLKAHCGRRHGVERAPAAVGGAAAPAPVLSPRACVGRGAGGATAAGTLRDEVRRDAAVAEAPGATGGGAVGGGHWEAGEACGAVVNSECKKVAVGVFGRLRLRPCMIEQCLPSTSST